MEIEYLLNDFAFQPLEAWFWIIPAIIGAALGGSIVIFATIFGGDDSVPVKGKNIAVLGMQGAGKTQFLANIRNESYKDYQATIGSEGYDSFTIHLGDRGVKIEKGKDIGGGDEYIRDYYKDLINRCDVVFFLFDSYKYLNEEKYRENVQARLEFIHRHIGGKSIDTVIFATFADKFEKKDAVENAYSEIKRSIIGKTYGELFKTNFLLLDMRNKDELMKLLRNKIFIKR